MLSDTPFDRRLRRQRRGRAAARIGEADYLHRRAAEDLLARLDGVRRGFEDALLLGLPDPTLVAELESRGIAVTTADPGGEADVRCDEDMLPFGDGTFDLVVSIGGLDSVNDLPGALALIRRILRPDGLFLAALAGAGSLPRLRTAMVEADEAGGAAPRLHPQIDVRAAGDLLSRAGFMLPVADVEAVAVRFSSLMALVRDLRAMGGTNMLAARSRAALGRLAVASALAAFAAEAETDGKISERFEIVYLTGWSPSARS